MAAVKLFYISCVVLFTAVYCQEAQGALEEYQGYVNKISFWFPCNYTEIPGSSCQDCNKRLICTKVGGFVRPCWLPHRPFCVNGRCVPEPSEECRTSPEPPSPETTTPEEELSTSEY